MSLYILNAVMHTGRISYWLGNWEPPYGIEYAIDYLNSYVLVIVTFIALAVTIYSKWSVEKELPEKTVLFYTVYLLLITGLLGITITGDIFNLYVFLEITSLSAYTLVAIGKKRNALVASYNYAILGTISATFILIAIGYLYMVTGTLNMADLSTKLPPLYDSKVVLTALAFFMAGFSIKVALFPLHVWLPDAYTHAPSVVSAILAATSTKVAAYAMIRVMFTVFSPEFIIVRVNITHILSWIAAFAIIVGSVLAIAQVDIKKMLAYSSVAQIGYIMLGIGLSTKLSVTGGILHILNHALMKATLFLVAGAVIYKTGIRNIEEYRGLRREMPLTMLAFTIAALSMIGVPGTVGFVSKWYLLLGALHEGKWVFALVLILSSLLMLVYFWRVIENIYFPKMHVAVAMDGGDKKKELPYTMLVPILILALLCIALGILAFIPLKIVGMISQMLVG
jgi:multicomponent Na+:H+ antiporter subunit D